MAAVTDSLEENLELLCVTGVEDQLQVNAAVHLLYSGWNLPIRSTPENNRFVCLSQLAIRRK